MHGVERGRVSDVDHRGCCAIDGAWGVALWFGVDGLLTPSRGSFWEVRGGPLCLRTEQELCPSRLLDFGMFLLFKQKRGERQDMIDFMWYALFQKGNFRGSAKYSAMLDLKGRVPTH